MRTAALIAALALAGLTTSASAQTATPTATTTAATTISMKDNCALGGTRTVAGTFNTTTGALNVTTTLTACVVRNGDKFEGTTTTAGTLLATATGATIDLTSSVNTTVTRTDLSKTTRTCTTTKKGTFTNANQTFDGNTTSTSCSVSGKVLEHENIVEHLLRPATGEDDGGGKDANQRTLTPQAGEDSIREQHDLPAIADDKSGKKT